jgi:dTDP-4-dehydrorhamnose 3,5-epimerase
VPIEVLDTVIPEVKIILGTRFYDERGFFTETYKESEYEEIGIPRFVQDNQSESALGVIRGLHWQEAPFEQGKLVSCIAGRILDVAVDVRKESPTYGEYVLIELNELDPKALWIPEGFAHGFQSLQEGTRVHYKVTKYWSQKAERGVCYNDQSLKIPWKDLPALVSEKDKLLPPLK